MYVTLVEIKEHLIIDHNLDDNYLIDLEKAAEDAATKLLNQDLINLTDEDDILTPSAKLLILHMVANWYANREPVSYTSTSEVPFTFQLLADLNRKY
jgi:hypothetical protein